MTRHRALAIVGLCTLAIILLALPSSCGSEGNAVVPSQLTITAVDIPAGKGDEAVSWTVCWEGGIAPYTISINTGGGALEDLPAGTPALSPFAAEFILVNGSFYLAEIHAYLVVITDASGKTAVAQGSYDVDPAEPPQLSIDDFSYDAASGLLRVVADADGWSTLLAELTLPADWIADASEREMTVSDNEAIAEFYVYPEDILGGGPGEFGVKVFDPDEFLIEPVYDTLSGDSTITLGADTLIAVPLRRHVSVGERVKIVVATGDLANPFNGISGICVTFDHKPFQYNDWGDQDPDWFNMGAPGGERWEGDGIWARMNAQHFTVGFWDYPPGLAFSAGGSWQYEVVVYSMESQETTQGGALFSFDVVFETPGEVHVGLASLPWLSSIGDAPTYSDAAQQLYEWDDYSNAAVPNTITVVAP